MPADRCDQRISEGFAKARQVFRSYGVFVALIHEMNINRLDDYGVVPLGINVRIPVDKRISNCRV